MLLVARMAWVLDLELEVVWVMDSELQLAWTAEASRLAGMSSEKDLAP